MDGSAIQQVASSDFNTTATVNIAGAFTRIKDTGEVRTNLDNKQSECLSNTEYLEVSVTTVTDGSSTTKFTTYSCSDDSLVKEDSTTSSEFSFYRDNNVTIQEVNGSMQIIIIAPFNDDMRF